MVKGKFSVKGRIASFGHAANGLAHFFSTEHNSWLHAIAAIVVVIAGFIFRITVMEWVAVAIAIGMVFVSEIVNTAIEYLCDFIKPEYDQSIKVIKNLAAGAVLFSAVAALVIGILVFVL